eukprot:Pgem_evm2s3000
MLILVASSSVDINFCRASGRYTPAYRAGLNFGDEILEINDFPVCRFTHCDTNIDIENKVLVKKDPPDSLPEAQIGDSIIGCNGNNLLSLTCAERKLILQRLFNDHLNPNLTLTLMEGSLAEVLTQCITDNMSANALKKIEFTDNPNIIIFEAKQSKSTLHHSKPIKYKVKEEKGQEKSELELKFSQMMKGEENQRRF